MTLLPINLPKDLEILVSKGQKVISGQIIAQIKKDGKGKKYFSLKNVAILATSFLLTTVSVKAVGNFYFGPIENSFLFNDSLRIDGGGSLTAPITEINVKTGGQISSNNGIQIKIDSNNDKANASVFFGSDSQFIVNETSANRIKAGLAISAPKNASPK